MISFNEEMAAEYGLNVIIFCSKIADWLKWNKANEQNYHDGKYWTYNTLTALTRLFPFWSVDQLRKVIKDAMAANLIVKGNYNKSPYDKTLWYTLTDFGCKLLKIPMWEIHHIGSGQNPDPSGSDPAPIPIKSTHNINQKSFCSTNEKKSKEQEPKKIENEKKHDWAEKKSGFADVTKQTTSYDPNSPGRQAKVSPLLEQYEKSMPTRISDLICKNPLQINT